MDHPTESDPKTAGGDAPSSDSRRVLHNDVVVVLSEPRNVVNIAAAARAMMNNGLRRLRLVRPAEYDEHRILGIAHAAAPVLERTEILDTLDEALHDALHVAGTTARRRTARYVWDQPRDAAPEILRLASLGRGPVALLFGREDRGLANEELDRCDRLLTVPTDPAFASLNLAQAVLLVSYELWMAGPGSDRPLPRAKRAERPASNAELEEFFQDASLTLETIEFFKKRNPEAVLRTIRALTRRAGPDAREAKLLRAMAIEVRAYLKRRLT